MLHNYNFDNII